MPLVNMVGMLSHARDNRYAVGAFNIVDYASMRAVVAAAAIERAPVIIQTSGKTVDFWGAPAIAGWARELGSCAEVPVALHLDHCKDPGLIGQCIEAGWTSVMFDGSSRPFEENLSMTCAVVRQAHDRGVSVEAELGEIGGVEDDVIVKDEHARLADPARAVEFCARTGIDCFAPAIGTAHGIYKGEPRLAFDRLECIARDTGVPIALHGGTGLSEEVFRRCIRLGCAKVNISTLVKHTFIDSFVHHHQNHPSAYDPLKTLAAQMKALENDVVGFLRLFGCAGHAFPGDA